MKRDEYFKEFYRKLEEQEAVLKQYSRNRKEQSRKRRHKTYTAIWRYKEGQGCFDCGERDPRLLEFDHREPHLKSFSISSKAQTATWEELLDEVAKCDVVCCNCHRLRTRKHFKWSDFSTKEGDQNHGEEETQQTPDRHQPKYPTPRASGRPFFGRTLGRRRRDDQRLREKAALSL